MPRFPLFGLGLVALFAAVFSPRPVAAQTAVAHSSPELERLSLREAIEMGLRTDPGIVSAIQTRERGKLAVLRAQLDRVSLRVDAFLNEQYRVSNLGGSPPSASCATFLSTKTLAGAGDLYAPLQLYSLSSSGLSSPTETECQASGGTYITQDALQMGALGQFNLAANLNVPLFSGFRVTATVERARQMRDAAEASVKQSERQIALEVLRAYWSARRLELQIEVSQKSLARYDEAAAAVAARVRNGLAPAIDQNRMETRRQSELSRRADLEGGLLEAKAQLAVLIGKSLLSTALNEPVDVPQPPSEQLDTVDQILLEARHRRPELRSAHAQLLAQTEVIRIARSGYYPQLSLSGLVQFSNNPFNPLVGARVANSSTNPFTNITGSVFVGGALSYNLFDTLNTYTSVRDAQLEEKRLLAEERRIGRVIESDVRVLHARLVHLYRVREPLLRTQSLARDNLSILERRYRNGDVAIIDLIESATDLINQDVQLANQTALIAQTWGELYLAAGRLPQSVQNEATEQTESLYNGK